MAGKKITDYANNVSVTPDNGSYLDLSEKLGVSSYESRKWTLTAFKTWVNSWVVASSIAWSNITGKPTTIAGYGITDAIDGAGTANKVAKFSDSNTLADSQITDDGTNIGINSAVDVTALIKVVSTLTKGLVFYQTKTSGTNYGASFYSNGSGATSNTALYGASLSATASNTGVNGSATGGASVNYGVLGEAGNGTTNYAVYGSAVGTGKNVGVTGIAQSGSSNYSARFVDGTEGVGKVLKCVTVNGEANWANITTADISTSVQSVTSSATVTATSTNDLVKITAQAEALTLANPTGTFAEGQPLMIRIKDNGTARAISYGAKFRAIGVTLPTTTVISKTLYLGVIYNSTDDTFDVLGVNQQA